MRVGVRHALRGLAVGASIAAGVVGGALGIFVAAFGWQRFLADFWPLDNSRVGPNLVASVVATVLIVAHNEYRTAVRAVESGESLRQTVRDLEDEVLHPVETAEQHIADDIEENDGSPSTS